MGTASMLTWAVDRFLLKPLRLEYLQTIAFILVIAALVQLVEMFLEKMLPSLYSALGIYLPLITTNCAVLGAALLNIQNEYTFLQALVFGVSAAIGFTVAIVLFSGVREQLEFADIPEFLRGFPIALIAAGLISIAFLGFAGLRL
jgi:electron transport complex protein RnfA